ncbi:Uncharacterised protein [Vibrio cholerae]|nr:Uncharacterised protein [Vibrio cholerae]CSI45582.1 Uncharacterised protein [Vibrio cholerae]
MVLVHKCWTFHTCYRSSSIRSKSSSNRILKDNTVLKPLFVLYFQFRAITAIQSCNTLATVLVSQFLTLKNVKSVV